MGDVLRWIRRTERGLRRLAGDASGPSGVLSRKLSSRALTAWVLALACGPALAARPGPAQGESTPPAPGGVDVGVDNPIGTVLPLELELVDSAGESRRLGDFFGERPVLVTPVYFECPMLCTQELSGLAKALRALDLDVGVDFDLVTYSIDPGEGPTLAADKRRHYLDYAKLDADTTPWEFLTGSESSIAQLNGALGFRVQYLPDIDEYAHAAAMMLANADGEVTHVFFGIEPSARDLRFAIVEASQGERGSWVDSVLMLCYQYDPTTGTYGLAIFRTLRVLGVVTVVTIGGFVFLMLRRERRARRLRAASLGSLGS